MKIGGNQRKSRGGMPLPQGLREWLLHPARKRGGALILTLLVVALLTIMVVAFFSTMRIEQQASHAYANSQRAKMVAQGAVSHGVEILRTYVPEPALIGENAGVAPGENWIVNPGRLTVYNGPSEQVFIALHTGGADRSPEETNDPDVYSVDLNEPLPGETDPAICTALNGDGSPDYESPAPQMRVRWMPVLEDPGEAPSEENPITGRYAFWMDDECAKINFNVALGKPARDVEDPQRFWQQYDLGLMTPLFTGGQGDVEYNQNSKDREWALGKLRSINLDVLFDNPAEELNSNALLAHAWLRGFSRYPEAILDFVELDEEERNRWYRGNRFNLSFYSRGPEFNAFGRSRLFTTNIPLSLEAGPLYQLPFVYNGPEAPEPDFNIRGVMHLHSLMGSLGFTHVIADEDLGRVHAANIVNRAQFEMLRRYMTRPWPGYRASFVDKYGERECYQMALSMLTMARMATTTMSSRDAVRGGNKTASRDWAWRSTSVIYSPHNKERSGATPERHYWQINLDDAEGAAGENSGGGEEEENTVPMLPEMPGPHITEVRLILQPEKISATKYKIAYRYEVEYYQNRFGPTLYLNYFPAKVDYLHITADGGGQRSLTQEFGPETAEKGEEKHRADRNWNLNRYRKIGKKRVLVRRSLGSLRASAGGKQRIGSEGSGFPHRVTVSCPRRYIGKTEPGPNTLSWIPLRPNSGDVAKFDATKGRNVTVDVKWRLGMGVRPDARRPRQMIPLGELPEDVLEATFEIDLRSGDRQVVSWQINDPRLSWHKDEWIKDTEDEGTPGARNEIAGSPIEPEEISTEKSKFRYFQRGPGAVTDPETPDDRPFGLNRPDEYNSRSRVSSKGYWSVLHTGIQNRVPWRTLDLGGGTSNEEADPPDYLLLDLLGATYPMQHDQWRINSTLPDEFSTVSFMNSTAGQINLNSKIYPDHSDWFQAPKRRKPLEAVFKHLREDSDLEGLLEEIERFQDEQPFRYIGDLSRVDGYLRTDTDATQFQNEELLRNMAGCLTTKSNTFGMWGVSQVVKKIPGNSNWKDFEDGDRVLAEKRFYAVIERYIWPGNDGVPGNAHVSEEGIWDRIAKQQAPIPRDGNITDTLFHLPGSPPLLKPKNSKRLRLDWKGAYPWFDGPQEVEMDRYASRSLGHVKWTQSTLEDALNPPQPVVKYRVAYFKYLDE